MYFNTCKIQLKNKISHQNTKFLQAVLYWTNQETVPKEEHVEKINVVKVLETV